MIASQVGTVVALDRVNGTVDAKLRSGQMLSGVPYLSTPPWKGLDARFTEVANGAWVCDGLQGDQGGYGPNLCINSEFVEDITGWDNTASTAWNFDGTTESWVALASTTLAVNTTFLYNGTGALSLTATGAATIGATSPTGASGVTVVAGTQYNANVWVRANPTLNNRVARLRIKWYTAAGAVVSDSAFGATVTTDGAAWRSLACTAVAPATAARAALEVQFVSAASGDIFYLDTAVLTGGTSATLTRDATSSYSGSASLRIRSAAAGICYAQTPSPATDPLGGIPVNAGEVYYVDCRFRQSNSLQMFIVAAWVFADGTTVADFDYNSRSQVGTSSYQYFVQTFTAPSGAVAVHFAFAFIATGATQDLNLDSVKIRQALLNPGAGLSSVVPDNFSWSVGGRQQQPGSILWVPQENDYPRAVVNGYVQGRAIHARLTTPVGSQNITNNTWTTVSFNTIAEATGIATPTSGGFYYVVIPRSGVYVMSGQVNWADQFGTVSGGTQAVTIERWSSDGATFLELVCAGSAYYGVTWSGVTNSCATAGVHCNRDERILLRCYQAHGGTYPIQAGGGAVGLAHMLSVTYSGDD